MRYNSNETANTTYLIRQPYQTTRQHVFLKGLTKSTQLMQDIKDKQLKNMA